MHNFYKICFVWFIALVCGPSALADALLPPMPDDEVEISVIHIPADQTIKTPENSLLVTGAYTGINMVTSRENKPHPVGLFLHDGEVINRHMAPMDGILIVQNGDIEIHHRERVEFRGELYNLRKLSDRSKFIHSAVAVKADVLQSHLLIVSGELDVRPREDAPEFRRRMLYVTDMEHVGVYDTGTERMTLYEAAKELWEQTPVSMALNLDMGSYDYCQIRKNDEWQSCGVLSFSANRKLSNLLQITPKQN